MSNLAKIAYGVFGCIALSYLEKNRPERQTVSPRTAPEDMLRTRITNLPATKGFDITPTDTVDDHLPAYTRFVFVGGAGDLRVEWADGTLTTFPNVPAGSLLPICVVRVAATGTTATNLRGGY